MKYILIDLDGTLLDFNKGEKYSFIDTIKAKEKHNNIKL